MNAEVDQTMTVESALIWIANLFEEPVENVNVHTRRNEIPAWDSLGILSLIAALDEEFDIRLSEKEIQVMKSVEDLLRVFGSRGYLDYAHS
jgi:acyl carrier protein